MSELNTHSELEKTELQHSAGKSRAFIVKREYELLSVFILNMLKSRREITLTELLEAAREKLNSKLSGETLWITLNVKNDLEAKRLIKVTHQKRCVQIIRIRRKGERYVTSFLRSIRTNQTALSEQV